MARSGITQMGMDDTYDIVYTVYVGKEARQETRTKAFRTAKARDSWVAKQQEKDNFGSVTMSRDPRETRTDRER